MTPTGIGTLKARRDALTARVLEIEADLAEMRRAWACDGTEGDLKVRRTLEAELAVVAVERNRIYAQLRALKHSEQALRDASLTAALLHVLHTNGLYDLVEAAQRLSLDRLQATPKPQASAPTAPLEAAAAEGPATC
jgi:hypothetical protein